MAGLRRGEPTIHQLHIATVLLSLVEQLTLDLKETGIAHCLRQAMESLHPLRVEVFQANQGIGSGNMRRHLMQGILALACYAIVCLCQFPGILPPVLTALDFACEPFAQALDARLTTTIVFLVFK